MTLRRLCAGVLALALALAGPVQAQGYRPTGTWGGFRGGFQFVCPVAWTPDLLASAIVGWWDGRAGLTFNSGSVASWTDRVNGLVLTQATAANQPGYSATARNGAPGLTFNGSSQYLSMAQPAGLPTGTSPGGIVVAAALGAVGSYPGVVSYGPTGSGANRTVMSTSNFDKVSASITGYDPNSAYSWVGIDRLAVVEFLAANSLNITVDGNATASFTGGTMNTGTGGTLQLGRLITGANYATMTLQHVILTNRALTASERQKLEGWESWTDGKAGANLPAAHPYKLRPPCAQDAALVPGDDDRPAALAAAALFDRRRA